MSTRGTTGALDFQASVLGSNSQSPAVESVAYLAA